LPRQGKAVKRERLIDGHVGARTGLHGLALMERDGAVAMSVVRLRRRRQLLHARVPPAGIGLLAADLDELAVLGTGYVGRKCEVNVGSLVRKNRGERAQKSEAPQEACASRTRWAAKQMHQRRWLRK
jgi:hypothetical protein